MSKLDELIAELCPNGVEHVKLGEIAEILRGKRLTKSQLSNSEQYPVYHGGLEPLGYYAHHNRKADTVMVINVGASAGTVGYSSVDFWSSDGCFCVGHSDLLISRYVYYALLCQEALLRSKVRFAGIPTLDGTVVEHIKIPFPPLPIQQEIVRILDNFTKLTAELTEELTARRKQYEYYRDEFFGDNYYHMLKLENISEVEKVPLSGVGKFIRGKRFVKADMINEGTPCIHYGELYTHYGVWAIQAKSFISPELATKLRFARKGNVVVVAAGETVEDIGKGVAWLADSDVVVHDACYIFEHNLEPKYVSYFLRTKVFQSQIKRYISTGKISSISADGLGKALIPVPAIEVQKRIVSILDRFEALCNDLASGLPAEIEARQKQYEYYRDKLLSFKEVSA